MACFGTVPGLLGVFYRGSRVSMDQLLCISLQVSVHIFLLSYILNHRVIYSDTMKTEKVQSPFPS